MSEDNGFVERPVGRNRSHTGMTARLIETANNGKAIVVMNKRGVSSISGHLGRLGYRSHQRRQADGTFLCWAEKIEALDALTLLIQKLDGLETSPTVRYAMADALTARDEVTQVVEQTRPRRSKKKEATT